MWFFRHLTKEEILKVNLLVSDFENKFCVQLPVSYKSFISNFKTGVEHEHGEAFIDEFLQITPIYAYQVSLPSISFNYCFLEMFENILEYAQLDYGMVSHYLKYQLLRIGDIGCAGGILIGIGEDNKDNIYVVISEMSIEPIFVCNGYYNFFSLIKPAIAYNGEKLWKTPVDRYYNRSPNNYALIESKINEIRALYQKEFNYFEITPFEYSTYNILIRESFRELFINIDSENILYGILLEIFDNPLQFPFLIDDVRFIPHPFTENIFLYKIEGSLVKVFDINKRPNLIKI